MIAEAPAPAHVPGRCRDHPDVVLVSRRTAGLAAYYDADPPVICRSCPIPAAARCAECGGPLPPSTELGNGGDRRRFCSDRCRLRAWRRS